MLGCGGILLDLDDFFGGFSSSSGSSSSSSRSLEDFLKGFDDFSADFASVMVVARERRKGYSAVSVKLCLHLKENCLL